MELSLTEMSTARLPPHKHHFPSPDTGVDVLMGPTMVTLHSCTRGRQNSAKSAYVLLEEYCSARCRLPRITVLHTRCAPARSLSGSATYDWRVPCMTSHTLNPLPPNREAGSTDNEKRAPCMDLHTGPAPPIAKWMRRKTAGASIA